MKIWDQVNPNLVNMRTISSVNQGVGVLFCFIVLIGIAHRRTYIQRFWFSVEKRGKKYKKKNLLLKRIKSALATGLHIKFGIFMGFGSKVGVS